MLTPHRRRFGWKKWECDKQLRRKETPSIDGRRFCLPQEAINLLVRHQSFQRLRRYNFIPETQPLASCLAEEVTQLFALGAQIFFRLGVGNHLTGHTLNYFDARGFDSSDFLRIV